MLNNNPSINIILTIPQMEGGGREGEGREVEKENEFKLYI